MAVTVTGLYRYPVKSLRGHALAHAEVRTEGLAGDRRWMIVDSDGRFQTQRSLRRLAQIDVTVTATGLDLYHDEAGHLSVVEPTAGATPVVVWRDRLLARLAAAEAHSWLSAIVGADVRLVFMHDVTARQVAPDFGAAGDYVSFADGFPLLLTTTDSLADLNRRGHGQHTMRQFRPNLVVEGAPAWAEDTWRLVRIGTIVLRVAKPCARCVVTTLDPETGVPFSATEPLRTLGTFHRNQSDGGICFGQNLIASAVGRICLGDEVQVLEAGRSNLEAAL